MNFPSKLELRIDWSELDLFGHVNNVAFMKYIQAARVHYWEQVGIYSRFLETRRGPMLASTSCEFKSPLFYPGAIEILSSMEFIKNTSFGIQHHIYDHNNTLAAVAHDVMVLFDFNTNQKIQFPEELRKNVERFENRSI